MSIVYHCMYVKHVLKPNILFCVKRSKLISNSLNIQMLVFT